ncbi:MAG TPA: hypothetical protein VHS31_19190 [Tepidisphaeraceae bacterium]|jgi:antitoxin MazE|nr:hypothetical protein [Tepidisphaeraceae bacterium]
MKTKLIPIGNSKGIRIPKSVLEQCSLGEDIEMNVRGDSLVIQSARNARQGWDQMFAKMRQRGDDKLKDEKSFEPSQWDRKEWTW